MQNVSTQKMTGCGVSKNEKLIFSCSGAADVGELADRCARRMTKNAIGKMFCLVGIGGQVDKIMQTTKTAQAMLAIDGCSMHCAKKCLEKNGFTNFVHLRIEDLGFKKGQTKINEDNIVKVVEKGSVLFKDIT